MLAYSSIPRFLPIMTLCAASGVAQQAAAQSVAAVPDQQLGEVSVVSRSDGSYRPATAQVGSFRDQSMLDVPLTVNVVPRAVLDAQAATGIHDALRNTAGVTRSQLNGVVYDNLSIRGIIVENRTNYRLNGSLPINNLVDMPLENKERVEVLKGLSGLYYGFTSPSGIVNLVTKRATTAPVTSLAFQADEYGTLVAHADIGRRFGAQNQFGVRINAAGGRLESAIDGIDGKRSLGSLAFDWRVTSALSIKADIEHIRKKITEQSAIALLPAQDNRIALPRIPDPTNRIAPRWADYDAEATNALLRADYSFTDNWVGTLEVGQAETERDRVYTQIQNYDPATGAGTLSAFQIAGQEFRNRNARGELNGRVATGSIGHELTVGYTQNRRDQRNVPTRRFSVEQNLYQPREIGQEVSSTQTAAPAPQSIRDQGLYLFDRVMLSDKWQVLAGLRYSDYRNTAGDTVYDVNETSPSLGVIHKLTPKTSLYATYIEGMEEGGTAPANAANAFATLSPAISEQKEIGVRAEVGGTLLSAAVFDIERASAYRNSANFFVVDGRTRYRGLELSAQGEMMRNWSLIASAQLLNAEINGAGDAALIGKRPENTPRITATLFAEHRLQAVAGLALSGGVYYIGEREVNNLNQERVGGHALWNIGARYATSIQGQKVTLQANLDNATDKRYWNSAGNGLLGVGMPRTLKVAARLDF